MYVIGTCEHVPVAHNTPTQEALALQHEARLFPQKAFSECLLCALDFTPAESLCSCHSEFTQSSMRLCQASCQLALPTPHTHASRGGCRWQTGPPHNIARTNQEGPLSSLPYLSFPGRNLADLPPSSQNCVRMDTIPFLAFILGPLPRFSTK